MDAIVNFVSSWPNLVQRAFCVHALVVAFITHRLDAFEQGKRKKRKKRKSRN